MAESTQPIVSVLVATHNQGEYLTRCLESVLRQTLSRTAYGVVVVDDGSTDQTADIIAKYRQDLQIVTHERRMGLAAACNAGVQEARGTFVVRVDSDDWLEVKALELLTRVAEITPKVDIVMPEYWIVEDQEHRLLRPDLQNIFTWMAGGCLLRREAILLAGGYRDMFWEEYDLYLRMLSQGAVTAALAAPVLYHQEHVGSMTAHQGKRTEGWQELIHNWPLRTLQQFGFSDELARQ